MNALKSEWLKLVSVRTTWALLGSMILIEGLTAGLVTGLSDIADLRKRDVATLAIGTHLAIVFMFTLGALLSTNEFRHGTANSTFVVTPKRERVIAAKLVVGLVVGIVGALLYITVNAGLGLSILSSRGVDVDADMAVNTYIGVGVGLVLGCLFGVALGALLRNQILTVVTGMVLFLLAGHGGAVHRQRRRPVLPRRVAAGAERHAGSRQDAAQPDRRRARAGGLLRRARDRRHGAHARARDRPERDQRAGSGRADARRYVVRSEDAGSAGRTTRTRLSTPYGRREDRRGGRRRRRPSLRPCGA